MKIEATLFDANGANKDLELEDLFPAEIGEKQLLWIRISERRREPLEKICEFFSLSDVPFATILSEKERPKVDIFENYFRFFIASVALDKADREKRIPIDFIVGRNFVVTISNEKVEYFDTFLKREKGERQIGELDAESFVAALLDLHIVSYFNVIEEIEETVDEFDAKILKTDLDEEEFLKKMVHLRTRVSRLRRWFLPHRDVFYALSRADFQRISESDSADQFAMLNAHFENAVDAIESSRDTVLSLFDLYATRSAQKINNFIQRLTFLTLIFGALSVVAGTLGMNYKAGIFESDYGFEITIGLMLLFAGGLTLFARLRRWI